ncbi:MAG: S8 family serine peptidase, partial [Planctomycetes bacterium]|nr:S8 family serine peptidase [Planctomycetota bacterium]
MKKDVKEPRRPVSYRALVLSVSFLCAGGGLQAQGDGDRAALPRAGADVRTALRSEGRAVALAVLKAPGPSAAPLQAQEVARRAREAARRAGDRVEARLLGASGAPGGGVAPGSGWAAVRRRFRWVPALLLEIRDERALDLLEGDPDVASVHLDERGRGALFESLPYIHAARAHNLGLHGEGTTVAVLDSGADVSHPALRDAVVHTYHFLGQGADVGPGGAEDGHGHGTNVTGIIASRGSVTPLGEVVPVGVAPAAKVVVVKVLDDENSGWLSDWALGVDHVIGLKQEEGIHVDAINMSLVSSRSYPGVCDDRVPVFAAACQAALDAGIVLLAASGNDGLAGGMTIPACYSSTVSVGSMIDNPPDRISSFTNRSEVLDLLAPGQSTLSTGKGGGTSTFMGTSQATPHAAAVALLLRQADPDIAPPEIAEVLVRSGRPFKDPTTGLVFPILDARAAAEAVLVPRVEGLFCAASEGAIAAAWDPQAGVDRFAVRVLRGEEVVHEGGVAGTESSVEVAAPAGGTYSICVRAWDAGGLAGLEACCVLAVPGAPAFRRGDCSPDGRVNIADPIRTVTGLFSGGPPPPCAEACDADDDGRLNITDAIYTLNFLFLGGPAPREPFPGCGADLAPPAVGCA